MLMSKIDSGHIRVLTLLILKIYFWHHCLSPFLTIKTGCVATLASTLCACGGSSPLNNSMCDSKVLIQQYE